MLGYTEWRQQQQQLSNDEAENFLTYLRAYKAELQAAAQDPAYQQAVTTLVNQVSRKAKPDQYAAYQQTLDNLAEVVNQGLSTKQLQTQKEQTKKEKEWAGPARASKLGPPLDPRFFSLYRKMSQAEADILLKKYGETKKNKQPQALVAVTADTNGRKWLSTTRLHSDTFYNENVDAGTKEVVLQFQLDPTAYERLIVSRFPAYKTDSYKNVNKDKVLIHQEGLAQGTNAVTKTDAELEKIFTEGEDYNVGFSSDQVAEVDKAIREITLLS